VSRVETKLINLLTLGKAQKALNTFDEDIAGITVLRQTEMPILASRYKGRYTAIPVIKLPITRVSLKRVRAAKGIFRRFDHNGSKFSEVRILYPNNST